MPVERMQVQDSLRAETPVGDALPAATASGACIAPAERASTGVRRSAWRKAPPSMPVVVYKRAGACRKPAPLPLLTALDELAYGPLARARLRRDVESLGIDPETLRMVHALARQLAGDALRGEGCVAPGDRAQVSAAWSAGLEEAVSRCGRLVAAELPQAGIRAALAQSFCHDRTQPAACDRRSNHASSVRPSSKRANHDLDL